MADTTITRDARRRGRSETIEYRLIVALCVVLLLPAAAVMRCLPRRTPGQRPRGRSVLGEARAMADTYIPFAFMG